MWVGDQFNQNHLFSTTHQEFFENALQIQHEFRPHWKAELFFQFGKQFGDGADSTVASNTPAIETPAAAAACSHLTAGDWTDGVYTYGNVTRNACTSNFTGASYNSEEGRVTYEFNKKLNATFRVEQFHNPNGFFGQPMFASWNNYNSAGPPIWSSAVKGSFNDVTWGANYNPDVHFRIRPEIRYDWQSGNYGFPAFGQNNLLISTWTGGTKSSQVTAAIDTVFYF